MFVYDSIRVSDDLRKTGDNVFWVKDEDFVRTKDHLYQIRDALLDAVSGLRYIREQHGDLYGVGWDRVEAKARAALKATEE